MNRWMKQTSSKAFTVIELLIVIVVIGILVAVVVVGYAAVQNNAQDGAIKADLQKIDDGFKQYALDNDGAFPDTPGKIAALNLKLTIGAYNTSNLANLYPCYNPTRTEYAVMAMSVSGKRFVVKSESGVSEYTGGVVWDATNDNRAATCTSINATYTEMSGGYTGYRAGLWATWTGVTLTCPDGFIKVPGNILFDTSDFCAMKYEAKQSGPSVVSQASGTPIVSVTPQDSADMAQSICNGCHLMTDNEWLTIAHNVLIQASNWTGGSVGSGSLYIGNNDASPGTAQPADTDDTNGYAGTGNSVSSGQNQRRTLYLSNGEVIWDFAGNVWEWTPGLITGSQPGGSGYAYREWNTIGNMAGLDARLKPSYGNAAAASWTSAKGLGALFSNSSDTSERSFYRGGTANQYLPANGGIFNVALDQTSSASNVLIGFRAAR